MIKCETCSKQNGCQDCVSSSNYTPNQELIRNSQIMRGEIECEEVDQELIDMASSIIDDMEEALGDRLHKKRSDYESDDDFESEETSKIYGDVYFTIENSIIDNFSLIIDNYKTQIDEYLEDLKNKKTELYNTLSYIQEKLKPDMSIDEFREFCYSEFGIESEEFDDIMGIEEDD